MSDKHLTTLRPHGLIVIQNVDGSTFEGETRQCCHCGGHWLIQPGSGKVRGWCGKCSAWFCSPSCMECIPYEKMLDIMDGIAKPTAVTVAGGMRLGTIGKVALP